jgi:predicted lipid-binding transport protein (Tim44 family)
MAASKRPSSSPSAPPTEEDDFFSEAAAPPAAAPGVTAPAEVGPSWNALLLKSMGAGLTAGLLGALLKDPGTGLTLGLAATLFALCFGALYKRPPVKLPPPSPEVEDPAAPAPTLAQLNAAPTNGVSDPAPAPAAEPARPLNRAERRQEARQKRKPGSPRRRPADGKEGPAGP